MRYLSLFSGIEAATVAWSRLGWVPVAFSEIDKHASELLAARYPNVPNLGDITKIDWSAFNERYGAIDLVAGGSPCQSFSIAGDRSGLAGPSGLMFEYVRAVREVMPRYLVWENVPGALSVERGGAFRQLLSELDGLGYGLAWRILDAQYTRVPDGPRLGFTGPVPQRRRRIFLVGSLGSLGAVEILFERSCLLGNHPTGKAARKALAAGADGGANGGGCGGFKHNQGAKAGSIGWQEGVAPTLPASSPAPSVVAFAQNTRDEVRLIGGDGAISGALAASEGMKQRTYICVESAHAHAAIITGGASTTLNASHEQPYMVMRDD